MDGDDTIISNAIPLLYDAAQSYNAQIVYGSHRRIEFLDGKEKETLYQYSAMHFSKKDDFASWVYRCYDGIQATTWNILIDLVFYVAVICNLSLFLIGRILHLCCCFLYMFHVQFYCLI